MKVLLCVIQTWVDVLGVLVVKVAALAVVLVLAILNIAKGSCCRRRGSGYGRSCCCGCCRGIGIGGVMGVVIGVIGLERCNNDNRASDGCGL